MYRKSMYQEFKINILFESFKNGSENVGEGCAETQRRWLRSHLISFTSIYFITTPTTIFVQDIFTMSGPPINVYALRNRYCLADVQVNDRLLFNDGLSATGLEITPCSWYGAEGTFCAESDARKTGMVEAGAAKVRKSMLMC